MNVTLTHHELSQRFTLRMLGEYVTLTGWQWLELLDSLKPDSELHERITARLESRLADS